MAVGIGTLIGHRGQRLLDRWGRSPSPVLRRLGWTIVGVAWLLAMPIGAALWLRWRNGQRDFMGVEYGPSWFEAILRVALFAVGAVFLVLVGRALSPTVSVRSTTSLFRHVPAAVAEPLMALLILLLVGALAGRVVLRALTALADVQLAPANEQITEDMLVPNSPACLGER